jgi:MoxR-like ATPase
MLDNREVENKNNGGKQVMDYTLVDKLADLRAQIKKKIVGNEKVLDNLLICLFSGGHILLESSPGMGKTELAKTLAETLSMKFNRIQCTPDIQPKDVLGEIHTEKKIGITRFKPGPIFANILLVDEINRAQPMTQSAFLQTMEEKAVTMEGETHPLPDPFMVIATQNPTEHIGTNELPEAQKDRFMLKAKMDYLNSTQELEVLDLNTDTVKTKAILSPKEILKMQKEMRNEVMVPEAQKKYIITIVRTTRTRDEVLIDGGGSTRAIVQFLKAVKARAYIKGRNYTTEDDITLMALPVLGHRIRVTSDKHDCGYNSDSLIADILRTTPFTRK